MDAESFSGQHLRRGSVTRNVNLRSQVADESGDESFTIIMAITIDRETDFLNFILKF